MTGETEGSKVRKKIAQLRALAASTTFPEEAKSGPEGCPNCGSLYWKEEPCLK